MVRRDNKEARLKQAWARHAQTTKGFMHAAVAYVQAPQRSVNQAIRQARKAICAECEHYRADKYKSCGLCKCRVPWKIGWASSQCPDNPPRWEAVKQENNDGR